MRVGILFNTNAYNDIHRMYKPATGDTEITVSGEIAFPGGYIDVTEYDTNSGYISANIDSYSWLLFWTVYGVDQYPVYAKVDHIVHINGSVCRVYYNVSWIHTYYNMFIQSGSPIVDYAAPFDVLTGARMSKTSDITLWDKWKCLDLPIKGSKTYSVTTGQSMDRITAQSAFLIVMKCPNAIPQPSYLHPQALYMVNYSVLQTMLNYYQRGDAPDPNSSEYQLPSVVLSCIQGIYYLPGVTVDLTNGTTNLAGVVGTLTYAAVKHIVSSGGTTENLDLITCNPIAQPYQVLQIDYNSTYAAYRSVTHNLTITLSDFRDIYYKSYKMYVPYVGLIDVPVSRLASYPSYLNNDVLNLAMTFYFDLYSGKFTYKWDKFPGLDAGQYVSLPQIPLVLSNGGISMYQSDARTELSALGAVINGAIGLGTGNPAALVNAGMSLFETAAKNDINKNVAAAEAAATVSAEGWSGYSRVYFYLNTESLDIALGNVTQYIANEGYPLLEIDAAISDKTKVWISAEHFALNTQDVPAAAALYGHEEDIREELNSLHYIILGGA